MPRKHIRVARDSIRLLDHSTDLKDQESTSQSPLVSAVTLIKPTKATRAIGGGIKKPTPKKALPVSDDPAKPYVCAEPKCLRGFARKSDLARHHRIHTNERQVITVDLEFQSFRFDFAHCPIMSSCTDPSSVTTKDVGRHSFKNQAKRYIIALSKIKFFNSI